MCLGWHSKEAINTPQGLIDSPPLETWEVTDRTSWACAITEARGNGGTLLGATKYIELGMPLIPVHLFFIIKLVINVNIVMYMTLD